MTIQENRKRLTGKVAIVTARRGIGRAEALLFAAQGAVVNDIAVQDGAPIAPLVVEQPRRWREAVANTDDVAEFQGAERLVKTALTPLKWIFWLITPAFPISSRSMN
jgi:NAD(P)-dependent dehydrogenase (short-subunit alcohol dehydrogenase family)